MSKKNQINLHHFKRTLHIATKRGNIQVKIKVLNQKTIETYEPMYLISENNVLNQVQQEIINMQHMQHMNHVYTEEQLKKIVKIHPDFVFELTSEQTTPSVLETAYNAHRHVEGFDLRLTRLVAHRTKNSHYGRLIYMLYKEKPHQLLDELKSKTSTPYHKQTNQQISHFHTRTQPNSGYAHHLIRESVDSTQIKKWIRAFVSTHTNIDPKWSLSCMHIIQSDHTTYRNNLQTAIKKQRRKNRLQKKLDNY